MPKMIYESSGQPVEDGIRILRVSDAGQTIEVSQGLSTFVPVKLTADKSAAFDTIEENKATMNAGFTDLTPDLGILSAEILFSGLLKERDNLEGGLWLKINEILTYLWWWPRTGESGFTQSFQWSPGDKVKLNMWLNSPAGQQMRQTSLTVPEKSSA